MYRPGGANRAVRIMEKKSWRSVALLVVVAIVTATRCASAGSGSVTGETPATTIRVTASESSTWYAAGLRSMLNDCLAESWNSSGRKEDFFEKLRECVHRRALTTFDSLLEDDVIPLFDGLDLVSYRRVNRPLEETEEPRRREQPGSSASASWSREFEEDANWNWMIWSRVRRVLQTHVFKVEPDRLNIGFLTDRSNDSGDSAVMDGSEESGTSDTSDTSDRPPRNRTEPNLLSNDSTVFEGRGRRHRRRHHHHNMMPMMMMGLLLMGSILIPMGFQFLAVLGGKALLLAKMALILSSIQGLKKIATNGVNYGLYHAPPVAEGWHERSNQEPGPRFDAAPSGDFFPDYGNNHQTPFRSGPDF